MTTLSLERPEGIRQYIEGHISPEPMSGCWLWTGWMRGRGYGGIRVDGKLHRAHRISYFIAYGEMPQMLDHKCRVRCCVNPAHLRPCTNKENVLAGIGPTAVNFHKTHCVRGHPLSGRNLQVDTHRGWTERTCLACKYIHDREFKLRKAQRHG